MANKTAAEWLDNAVRFEKEGKPKSIVDKALARACALELEEQAESLPIPMMAN